MTLHLTAGKKKLFQRLFRWYGIYLLLVLSYDLTSRLLGFPPTAELGEANIGDFNVSLALVAIYLFLGIMWLLVTSRSFKEVEVRVRQTWLTSRMVERIVGIVVLLAAVQHLFDVHGAVKASLPLLGGYGWDPLLADLDTWIHGGRDPWRWTHAFPWRHELTVFLDRQYVVWFGVLSTFTAISALWFPLRIRARFFLGYAILWVFAGGLAAQLFGSGGPVYFGSFTGDSIRFAPLIGYLDETEVVARTLQVRLWDAFTGTGSIPFDGISAMPSLHVAVAAYFAFVVAGMHRVLFLVCLAWAMCIFLGSVHLGWHYAVDGYAGIAFAWFSWWVAGKLVGDEPLEKATDPIDRPFPGGS
jgi:hypothetical protein